MYAQVMTDQTAPQGSQSTRFRAEMSTDGETWEPVRLPANCLPYHQCVNIGTYEERVGKTLTRYRPMDA